MGHKHSGEFKLRIDFFSIFFSFFFFFKANMNLTVFAGILLAVTMATARRASLVRKADEPGEAMREAARPASLVEKIMRAADEADEPDEAKRESMYDLGILEPILLAIFLGGKARRASLVRKADEPGEAMREAARPASLVEK